MVEFGNAGSYNTIVCANEAMVYNDNLVNTLEQSDFIECEEDEIVYDKKDISEF